MISLLEINPRRHPVSAEIDANLHRLLDALNVVRAIWGKPMVVTSGLRSEADQARINPSAPKSKHLIGAAADIADRDGSLKAWLMAHPEILERAGLWCEAAEATPTWCHFQIYSPKSGRRWFLP